MGSRAGFSGRGARFVMTLAVALAATGLGVAAGAEEPSAASDGGGLAGAQLPPREPGVELASKRTATSRTFRLENGALETHLYGHPIHYRAADGELKPIDEGLSPAADSALSNGPNAFDLDLPARMGEGPVRLSVDGEWIAYELLGSPTGAVHADGNVAAYPATDQGVRFQLVSLPNGVKENIVLSDISQPNEFRFRFNTSPGITPRPAGDGSIQFRDEEDRMIAMLPAPVMYDSSPEGAEVSEAVSYSLAATGAGEWMLIVEADRDWLSQLDRVWPVVIDPTLTLPAPSLACTYGGRKGENGWRACGTSTERLWASYIPHLEGVDEWKRSAVRFDVSSQPGWSYITSATLGLYSPTTAQNTSGVEVTRAYKSWTSLLNWRTYNGSALWEKEGGDFSAPGNDELEMPIEGAKVLVSDRGTQPGWWEFSSERLKWVVQDWLFNAPNQGLIVKLQDDKDRVCGSTSCTHRNVEFESSAAADPSRRPYLKLVYYPPSPSTSKVTSPREGMVTGRRLKLKTGWSVQGVTGVTFQYKALDVHDRFQTVPTNLVRKANGEPVSWPMPVQGNQSEPLYFDVHEASSMMGARNRKIQIRALFEGSAGAAGYSHWVNATVNPNAGGALDATASVGPGSVNLLTGNFTISRTDVSIPVFSTGLEFSRTYSSRPAVTWSAEGELQANTGVLGTGWEPTVPVETAGGAAWKKVRDANAAGEGPYAVLTDLEGYEYGFELDGSTYISPPDASGWILSRLSSTQLAFTGPDGSRTVFEKEPNGFDYNPVSVSQTGDATNKTRMVYQLISGKKRLSMVIAPAAQGIECTEASATSTIGCRALTFSYQAATTWGAPSTYGSRLSSITFHNSTAQGDQEVARYAYNADGKLVAQWDPRISPALKETYAYFPGEPTEEFGGGAMQSLTPPGEEPWSFEYSSGVDAGRLVKVKRASLLSSPLVAETTVVYGVSLSGSNAPYDMSSSAVAQWGQQDIPTDATAIFPPDQVPDSPPSSYSRATVYYMDAEGTLVNTATPAGAGTAAASITTSETDEHGNVVRELTAQNRLRALAAGAGSVARSKELDTHRTFNADGTEMHEEWGPLHEVRLESGATTQARRHVTLEYDGAGSNNPAPTPPAGTPPPHLPTRETVGASIPGQGADADPRVTETKYNWTLRKPTDTIVDPQGLNLRSHTEYSSVTGLPTERRQPSDTAGTGAGTTKIVYYTPIGHPTDAECGNKPAWSRLPCKIMPAAQPGTAGQPQILVKRFMSYNALGQPTEIRESPGGGTSNVRKTLLTYDAAGRPLSAHQTGNGTAIPKTESVYSTTTGRPLIQRFGCENACEEGFDDQALTTTYDTLGRPIAYQDADGNTSTTTYDVLSRPTEAFDGKGTQIYEYDPTAGLLVSLTDSGAGTFTAQYNADGSLVQQTLPNGLVAETEYDETGAPVHLAYEKTTNCLTDCIWLQFAVAESIHGQWLEQTSTLSSQQYGYDKAGRLTIVRDTPEGGVCTTRAYTYDANSNRKSLTTRAPEFGGACDTTSSGTVQNYSYDAADRLTGTGVVYDNYGRITSLPSAYSGGGTLTTSYFVNDLVRSQTQDGVTNTYELDAALRQRQRVQTGSESGTELYHYTGGSDSPAWIDRGPGWSRSIVGIGNELAAIQDSASGVTLQLSNLHGDIVATASADAEATNLLVTFESDEFGNPKQPGPARYAWLGGKQRRTELASGVVQMGLRSYIPKLGRFLSSDPIDGGSANAYDYSNADPINQVDTSGAAPKRVKCDFVIHYPHKSSHRRGRVNTMTTGRCIGPEVTSASATVKMTMYRNGRKIATTPERRYAVPVVPMGAKKFTQMRAPFVNAPRCETGYYRVVAHITVKAPPGYSPSIAEGTVTSRRVFIRC